MAKLNFNPLCHTLSIILTFSSFVLLMAVVFNNAPLDHEHSTLEGQMNSRFWLLVVNQSTDASTVTFDRRTNTDSKRQSDLTQLDYNLRRSTIDEPEEASVLVNSARNEDDAVHDQMDKRAGGLHAYGFGIWGWCEWSNADWTGYAKCTKKVFWSLPKYAVPSWDSIDQVMRGLPAAITKATSITSFFLLFAPFLVLSFLILLLSTIRFEKPYPPWPVPPKSQWPKGKEMPSKRTRIAWILRDWRTHLIYFMLMLVFCLPTIVTVLVGKSEVNANGGLKADTGYGFIFLWVAWVFLMFSQGLCMFKYGLIYKRKERSKQSTG
ncbi:hypothetical protein V865_004178 [Kwoniella europaea PYCC6329]|uniref:Uncharacterized protein n=1 Tax=Kwoniella europaea PYCC6329 TaxID=1423913 RepID=A0AAX4KJV8_9TREE